MKRKTKLIISAVIAVIIIISIIGIVAQANVKVGARNSTSYFQSVSTSGSWKDLKTTQYWIEDTSPEQVAYCLHHKKANPSGSTYYSTDKLDTYSSRVKKGLRIILENGYPYNKGGLSSTQARYATGNAIRFWMSENGQPHQYNFTNLSSYSNSQLRSKAATGKIDSKVRAKSGYTDVLQFSIELLIKARSQSLMMHSLSVGNPSMSVSGSYFRGTTRVTLTNMNGGYTINTSSLPNGSVVNGYTGNSGDTLEIKIPLNSSNENRTFSFGITGNDSRTRSSMFVYNPVSSSLQSVIGVKPANYHAASTKSISISTPAIPRPDLIVTNLTTNMNTYNNGETITVTATVKNNGSANAGAFYVGLSSNVFSVQTKYIGGLTKGASTNVSFTFTAPVYTSDKSVTFTCKADYHNTILESNESNNTRTKSITILKALPDLTITSLTSNKSSYNSGETITVTATVKNQGNNNAGTFYVGITSGGVYGLQTRKINSLSKGVSTTVSFTFTSPVYTSNRTITFTSTADYYGHVGESNEGNNSRSRSITALRSYADLTVTSLTANKTSYNSGETITITATIKNQGKINAGIFYVGITSGNVYGLQTRRINSLSVGASITVSYSFTAPIYTSNRGITFTCTADYYGHVAESNESNNSRNRSITALRSYADLVVTSLSSNKSSYNSGETITITATIKNQGKINTSAFYVGITSGGVYGLQTRRISSLSVGASTIVSYTFTAPVYSSNKTITFTCTSDYYNHIAESNEGNNSRNMNITILRSYADLVVTSLTTNKNSYDSDETITVTAVIKNQGKINAGAFYVKLTSGNVFNVESTRINSLGVGKSTTVSYTFTAPVYSTNRTVTFSCKADDTGTVLESNENNNTRNKSIIILRSYADLRITALTTNKNTYENGEIITVKATIKNQGKINAGRFDVKLSSGNTFSVQTKQVSSLNVGSSTVLTFTFTAPVYSTDRTVTFLCEADSEKVVLESNETNNTRTKIITILKALPDLTLTSITTSKARYESGESITVYATVKNIGKLSSPTSKLRLTVNSIGNFVVNVSGLAINQSRTVSITMSAPTSLSPLTLSMTATADYNNQILEMIENNNSRNGVIYINALRPDITIVDSTIQNWYSGKYVCVSASLKNLTAQPVQSFTIKLQIGSVTVTENICISGNGTNLAVFKFRVPSAGNYNVVITADSSGVINEINENNNTLSKNISVINLPSSYVVNPDDENMEQIYETYGLTSIPNPSSSTYHTWQEERYQNGSYVTKSYWARLTTTFNISPDSRLPDNGDAMESGYGISTYCRTVLTTNYDKPEKLVGIQNVWLYNPESRYATVSTYQNVRNNLNIKSGKSGNHTITWEYKVNPYSVTGIKLHYTPIWYPNGSYDVLAQVFYAWSPIGQMYQYKNDSVIIEGDMYDNITNIKH